MILTKYLILFQVKEILYIVYQGFIIIKKI